jgi:hypothetical protein
MDEALLRQLTRQLKILNFWITVVGTLILASIIVCIILLFKVVTFVQNTADRVTSIQNSTKNNLNVQKQLCESKNIGSLLQDRSSICK